ncbi:unnamed protein product [Amoebophrya sp. A120]|nr:unnamed protein product [Amoebophrya sp. A120]|eukprot:GSA120T00007439001.1
MKKAVIVSVAASAAAIQPPTHQWIGKEDGGAFVEVDTGRGKANAGGKKKKQVYPVVAAGTGQRTTACLLRAGNQFYPNYGGSGVYGDICSSGCSAAYCAVEPISCGKGCGTLKVPTGSCCEVGTAVGFQGDNVVFIN